jgi:hypothetical protein
MRTSAEPVRAAGTVHSGTTGTNRPGKADIGRLAT